VSSFRIEDLDLAHDATYTDPHGRKQPFTKAYLEQVLAKIDRRPDGSYVCLASRLPEGQAASVLMNTVGDAGTIPRT
jgi:hypothetical protein